MCSVHVLVVDSNEYRRNTVLQGLEEYCREQEACIKVWALESLLPKRSPCSFATIEQMIKRYEGLNRPQQYCGAGGELNKGLGRFSEKEVREFLQRLDLLFLHCGVSAPGSNEGAGNRCSSDFLKSMLGYIKENRAAVVGYSGSSQSLPPDAARTLDFERFVYLNEVSEFAPATIQLLIDNFFAHDRKWTEEIHNSLGKRQAMKDVVAATRIALFVDHLLDGKPTFGLSEALLQDVRARPGSFRDISFWKELEGKLGPADSAESGRVAEVIRRLQGNRG